MDQAARPAPAGLLELLGVASILGHDALHPRSAEQHLNRVVASREVLSLWAEHCTVMERKDSEKAPSAERLIGYHASSWHRGVRLITAGKQEHRG